MRNRSSCRRRRVHRPSRDRPSRRARARVGAAHRARGAARVARRRGRARAGARRARARGVARAASAREGVVEEVEEERRLRFRWDDDATGVPSRVEWTLHDEPGGTRVVVVERALVPLELRGVRGLELAAAGSRALARAASLARRVRRRRRLRGARGPDAPGGDRPARPGAARAPRRSPVSCRSAARRSPSTSRRSTAPASWRPGARAARLRYSLDPAPMGEAMAWMASVGAHWDERLARLARARAGGGPAPAARSSGRSLVDHHGRRAHDNHAAVRGHVTHPHRRAAADHDLR